MGLDERVWQAEREQRAYTLRRVYLLLIVGVCVYLPATVVFAPLEPSWYAAILTLLGALVIGLFVARKGMLNTASLAVVTAIGATQTAFVVMVGLTANQLVGLLLCVVLAGTLLGRWGAIVVTGLSVVSVLGFTYAEEAGLHVSQAQGPWVVALTVSGEILVIGVLLYWNAVASRSALRGFVETTSTLSVAQRRYAELVEDMADGVVIVSSEGQVIGVNPALERITGYEASELVGRFFWNLPLVASTSATAVRQHFSRLLAGDDIAIISLEIESRGSGRRYLRAAPRLTTRRDGAVEISATVRDVTDEVVGQQQRAQLEAELQEVRRLEALGRLAGSVAHDFNNWLTLITANAQLLEDRIGGHEELSEIRGAAERSAGLTRQLLTFARRQPTDPTWVDVQRTITELVPMLERLVGQHIELNSDVQTRDGVLIDPLQFEQVILNLVVNAREAMPDGGTITLRAATSNDHVCIDVLDDGDGIDDEVLDQLFEPFVTTKSDGTGLGLATVRGIVIDAGGTIAVEDTGPNGTHFSISLPVHQREQRWLDEEPPDELVVLVIDDDDAVRRTIERVLQREFTVRAVASAEAALESLEGVDVVLSDIVMPGMSGIELLEQVRLRAPQARFVLMSGYAGEAELERTEDADAFVAKPFSPTTLIEAIRGRSHN